MPAERSIPPHCAYFTQLLSKKLVTLGYLYKLDFCIVAPLIVGNPWSLSFGTNGRQGDSKEDCTLVSSARLLCSEFLKPENHSKSLFFTESVMGFSSSEELSNIHGY